MDEETEIRMFRVDTTDTRRRRRRRLLTYKWSILFSARRSMSSDKFGDDIEDGVS